MGNRAIERTGIIYNPEKMKTTFINFVELEFGKTLEQARMIQNHIFLQSLAHLTLRVSPAP